MPHQVISTGCNSDLHGKLWTGNDPPHAVLIVIHGLGDHSGRFAEVAEAICNREGTSAEQEQRTWAVFAFDLPGHGMSPGKPGGTVNFDSLLREISAACQTMTDRFGDLPQVLMGHSMGGNLAINHLLRSHTPPSKTKHLSGLVLCAPMLLPPQPMPRPWIFAAWLTGYFLPFIRFGKEVDAQKLTNDADEIRSIENDTLMHSRISLHLATQLVAQGRWAIDQARQINTATMILLGEYDTMIDRSACENLKIRIGQDAKLVTFADTKHALFHDKHRSKVIHCLQEWLSELNLDNN